MINQKDITNPEDEYMQDFYKYALIHIKAMQHMTEIHLNHPNATQIEDLREGRQYDGEL